MTTATITGQLNRAAKSVIESTEGGPFMLNDWVRAVFIHYEVDPQLLQRQVPYTLDVRDGRAFVSLVAFEMRRLRPCFGGRLVEWATAPVSHHGFLNVRTYVVHGGEPGIYFLAEWLPNAASVFIGPRTFGLPYRWGRLDYRHNPDAGLVWGRVSGIGSSDLLTYEAPLDASARYAASEADSLDEFLVERYSAFTEHRGTLRRFRIWHQPWRYMPLNVRVLDTSLIASTGAWFDSARLIGACYSPGVQDVWIGKPVCINGPACGTVWSDRPRS